MRFLTLLLMVVAAFALPGCGSSGGPRLPTIPVKGKLLVDGKPFGPCMIYLTNTVVPSDAKLAENMRTTTGKVKSDGTFVLSTYGEGDGAPVSTYSVKIGPDSGNMEAMSLSIPVCQDTKIEIAKSADGKPLDIEVKLESTGETSTTATGTMPSMAP